MTVYFYTLMCIMLIILCDIVLSQNTPISLAKEQEGISNFAIILIGAILIAVSGLRYNVGTDYPQYAKNFSTYLSDPFSATAQPALPLVAKLCAVFSEDYALWFFAMAVITIVPVLSAIKHEDRSAGLCVLLYLFLGCWHFSFNIVKQSAAASLLFWGYRYLRDRKFVQWTLICLLAATFHVSAIVMIPVYFLVQVPSSKWKMAAMLLIGVIVYVSYDRLFLWANLLKQNTGIISLYASTRNNSVNPLRVLVSIAPVLLCGAFYRSVDFEDRDFSVLFDLSFLNAVLSVSAMKSIYLYRFCCYTNIFNVLFIPNVIRRLSRNNQILIRPILLALYFAFWWYDLYKGSTTSQFQWIFQR